MKRILITGSNGQLGSELRALSGEHDEWTFYFTDVAELDITDREGTRDFMEHNGIEVVVNCAAYTAVDKAESEPEKCDLLNHIAPGYLAEAAEAVGATMIHISTDYVFDGCSHRPYTEDCPTNPVTVYGKTKLAGEEAVIRSCAGAMVIRTAWLYSTYGNNFVKTMLRLGREREELGVVFDQMGSPTYARHLAQAILHIIDKGTVPGVYHYTNEGVTSWYDFTRTIHLLAGIDTCRVRPLHTYEYPVAAARPQYSVLDKEKIRTTFDLDIPWWEDALHECLKNMD